MRYIEPTLGQYKGAVGRMVDKMLDPKLRMPPHVTAALLLKHRRSNGARAAVMAGLLVGALIERGNPDLAESVLKHLSESVFFTGQK